MEIVVFPECCITGYWFLRHLTREQLLALAEPVPDGPSTRALLELSRAHRMTIGAGLVEVDQAGLLHNTYVVAMPDGSWRLHRKIHAFESDDIVPGAEFTVFDTPHGCRVGVLICYDCNINENVRITALHGRRDPAGSSPDRRMHLEEPAPDGPHRAPRLGGAAQRPRRPSKPN